ncbi:hypothetical protein S40288_09653 [Stachybotrys chartarum IBT 40288]|nr:hypothetical protein S40288_09653 [Stachybotrys chartarum IBT 40288]
MAKHALLPASDEPLQIFQDDFFDASAVPMTSHAPMPAPGRSHRRPLGSTHSNQVFFEPPQAPFPFTYSPNKPHTAPPRNPLGPSHANKLDAMPMAPPAGRAAATDSLQKKPYLSNFKTAAAQKAPIDVNFGPGKENYFPQIFPAPTTFDFPIDNHFMKPNGKRMLMEAAPIAAEHPRPAKMVKTEEEKTIPPHDSFPVIVDDGTKPPHSYAQLIGMAILRSPNRRLTLAQIYKWISDTYSHYRTVENGWQNSIRHNLSLHKNFIKVIRPKDDPGKGNYWALQPGTEFHYMKEKPTRKTAPTAENLPVMSTRLEPSRPVVAPTTSQEPTLPPPMPTSHVTMPPQSTSQVFMSMPPEPSSDATILLSDAAGPEEPKDKDKADENELPREPGLYSPHVQSSPPVARRTEARSGTPPPNAPQPTSSALRSHKRKFASMDDSGYISSIESSVLRPNQQPFLLTSEADRPRMKCKGRARAEEEIRRLRNSSPMSPAKNRTYSAYGPVSSSPLRRNPGNQMLPPSTPGMKLQRPPRVPPSVSPNTSLRLHRESVSNMLQSPQRRFGLEEDFIPFSPAFNLDNFEDLSGFTDFEVFNDVSAVAEGAISMTSLMQDGSPIKRTAKRARLDRSASTSALVEPSKSGTKWSEILGTAQEPSFAQFLDTPSKAFEGLDTITHDLFQQSPSKPQTVNYGNLGVPSLPATTSWACAPINPHEFDNNTEFSADNADAGLDILQGFKRIGSAPGASPSKHTSKPSLARSSSTTF